MKKDKPDLIIDELLDAYARDLAEEEFEEFAHYFEEDEQYLMNKHLVENVRYEPTKPKKKPFRLAKYVAAAAAILIIFSVAIPTEASAWRIWDLDFWFGEHEDHTEVKPNDKDAFPQYYINELPEDFVLSFENMSDSDEYFQYNNSEGKYLIYMQIKREQYISQLDNENRSGITETIGDFRTLVSENDVDCIFEVITDNVAIYIQTNAGYDVGKKFLESIKEY